MAETWELQSGLAALHLPAREGHGDDPGVVLAERPFRGQINLRGDPADEEFAAAVARTVGAPLPTEPNTTAAGDTVTVLWLGPNEWVIRLPGPQEQEYADTLRRSLGDRHVSVTPIGHSRTVIGLSGPRSRDVLLKGCALDLHPAIFRPGDCAQTLLALNGVILHRLDDTDGGSAWDIDVRRSFARYAWLWLEDAALEYGYRIASPG